MIVQSTIIYLHFLVLILSAAWSIHFHAGLLALTSLCVITSPSVCGWELYTRCTWILDGHWGIRVRVKPPSSHCSVQSTTWECIYRELLNNLWSLRRDWPICVWYHIWPQKVTYFPSWSFFSDWIAQSMYNNFWNIFMSYRQSFLYQTPN